MLEETAPLVNLLASCVVGSYRAMHVFSEGQTRPDCEEIGRPDKLEATCCVLETVILDVTVLLLVLGPINQRW